jgi:hypothetical protein
MEENQIKTDPIGYKRNEDGTFAQGTQGGPGAPVQTEEEKIKRKALKEIKESYIKRLTEALPKIDPILIQKGIDGDLTAIKEINDRVLGKPRQSIGVDGGEEGQPIYIQLSESIAKKRNAVTQHTEPSSE